jgi:hypothetical protein
MTNGRAVTSGRPWHDNAVHWAHWWGHSWMYLRCNATRVETAFFVAHNEQDRYVRTDEPVNCIGCLGAREP